MGTEDVPQILMTALRDEVGVHLAQGRQVTVGVVANGGVVAVGDGQAVRGDLLAGQNRDPNATTLMGGSVSAGRCDDVDRVGQASHGADGDTSLAQMSAEHRVRRIVGA